MSCRIRVALHLLIVSVLLCMGWKSVSAQTDNPMLLFIRNSSPPTLMQYDPITRQEVVYEIELNELPQRPLMLWDETTLIARDDPPEQGFPTKLYIIDIVSGATRCTIDIYHLMTQPERWADNQYLFFGQVRGQNGLYSLHPDDCTLDLRGALPSGMTVYFYPRLSPDSSKIAFAMSAQTEDKRYVDRSINLIDLTTGERTHVVDIGPFTPVYISWSATSAYVTFYHEGILYLYHPEDDVLTTLLETSPPAPISASWSWDGTALIYGQEASQKLLIPATGEEHLLTSQETTLRFSQIEPYLEGHSGGVESPYIWRFENNQLGELIFEQYTNSHDFAPDGHTLAYFDLKTLTPALLNLDTEETKTFTDLTDYTIYSWSPQSRFIILRKAEAGVPCYLYDLQTDDLTELDPQCVHGWVPNWSPDERFVSYDRSTDSSNTTFLFGVYNIESHQKMDMYTTEWSGEFGKYLQWSQNNRFAISDPSFNGRCTHLLDVTTGETWSPFCDETPSQFFWLP